MNARAQISKEIKELLGQSAPIEFQDQLTQDLMAQGESRGKTNAFVIAENVVKMARQNERWAIEFIAERSEGKAAIASTEDNASRMVEEALNDVTTKHLNSLVGATGGAVGTDTLPEPEDRSGHGDQDRSRDRSAGPAHGLLDLPEDGDSGSQEA